MAHRYNPWPKVFGYQLCESIRSFRNLPLGLYFQHVRYQYTSAYWCLILEIYYADPVIVHLMRDTLGIIPGIIRNMMYWRERRAFVLLENVVNNSNFGAMRCLEENFWWIDIDTLTGAKPNFLTVRTALSPRIIMLSNCDCCVMNDELISFDTSNQDIALASIKAHHSLLLTIHFHQLTRQIHKQ